MNYEIDWVALTAFVFMAIIVGLAVQFGFYGVAAGVAFFFWMSRL